MFVFTMTRYRDASCVMWLASRERARCREDFARAVRAVLKKLSIDASSLRRGRWLMLTEDSVVRAECATRAGTEDKRSPIASDKLPGCRPCISDAETCCDEEDGVRIIRIGRR